MQEKTGRGSSEIITEKPAVGLFLLKKFYYDYKLTCYSDGNLLVLLSIDPANKHDVTVIKEKFWGIVEKFSGCFLFLDKGYVSGDLRRSFGGLGSFMFR